MKKKESSRGASAGKGVQPKPPRLTKRAEVGSPGVFISHSWGANRYVHEIVKLLDKYFIENGLRSWIDEKGLKAGEDWREDVKSVIYDPSFITVALVSPAYFDSQACQDERLWAERTANATGRRVIYVIIEDSEGVRDKIGKNVFTYSLTSDPHGSEKGDLFAEFCKFQSAGKSPSKKWGKAFRGFAGRLLEAIHSSYGDYLQTPHVGRYLDYEDEWLETALDVYDEYPKEYCHDRELVIDWISEGDAEAASNFPKEVFLCVSHRSIPLGMLYATLYCGETPNQPICLVHVLNITDDLPSFEDSSELVLDKGAIGHMLLEKLFEEIKADMRHNTKSRHTCDTVLGELPSGNSQVLEIWTDAVNYKRGFRLCEVADLKYQQPDMEWIGDDVAPTSEKANLVFISKNRKDNIIRLDKLKNILQLCYWVVHAENYHNPYRIHGWVKHLQACHDKTLKSLNTIKTSEGKIKLEPLRESKK